MKTISLEQFIAKAGSMNEASYALRVPYVTLQRWRAGKTHPSKLVSGLLEKAYGVAIPPSTTWGKHGRGKRASETTD